MADISSTFLGIRSPNPYWLASAPPTDKKYNVLRAFEAGWGGVVWKTLGIEVLFSLSAVLGVINSIYAATIKKPAERTMF